MLNESLNEQFHSASTLQKVHPEGKCGCRSKIHEIPFKAVRTSCALVLHWMEAHKTQVAPAR